MLEIDYGTGGAKACIIDEEVDVMSYAYREYPRAFSPTQKCPLLRDCIDSTRGFVRYVQEDDNINYLVLGLKVLEQFGNLVFILVI